MVLAALAGAAVALAVVGGFLALDRTTLHWYWEPANDYAAPAAEARTAFKSDEVQSLTTGYVARELPFPGNTDRVLCVDAEYRSQNHRWVVTCEYNRMFKGKPDCPCITELYVFDDDTGRVVD